MHELACRKRSYRTHDLMPAHENQTDYVAILLSHGLAIGIVDYIIDQSMPIVMRTCMHGLARLARVDSVAKLCLYS